MRSHLEDLNQSETLKYYKFDLDALESILNKSPKKVFNYLASYLMLRILRMIYAKKGWERDEVLLSYVLKISLFNIKEIIKQNYINYHKPRC